MEYLIKTYTNEGETVLDFTMGSGTTGVACKNLNRKFIGIELDETYFNIAEERIEKHTTQQKLFTGEIK
jgi:site-specific DNA-methyltransferase (adenine-specific)